MATVTVGSPSTMVATVAKICRLSKTVKALTLKIIDNSASFKPGQWVDVTLPGINDVTGYSMTSSPQLLRQQGLLNLAVKQSDHPITDWLFSKCTVGSEVNVKIGGDFFYTENTNPLLLIAAGVGINPLYSIMSSIIDVNDTDSDTKPVRLLYCASSVDELIFMRDIKQAEEQNLNLRSRFFVTQEKPTDTTIKHGRIGQEDVEAAVNDLPISDVQCYICGPPAMIDCMEKCVKQAGVSPQHVFSERWWSVHEDTH